MNEVRAQAGEVKQFDVPEWAPLVDFVGEEIARDFMWMCEVELDDGSSIHAYKHHVTRRYIHLNSEGKAFAYGPSGLYTPVEAKDVIAQVLVTLPGLGGAAYAQITASKALLRQLEFSSANHPLLADTLMGRAKPPIQTDRRLPLEPTMDNAREYEVILQAEQEGGYSVFVPELPSVATQGETREEALAMAKEAIEGYLEAMHDDGLPIPQVERSRVAVHA